MTTKLSDYRQQSSFASQIKIQLKMPTYTMICMLCTTTQHSLDLVVSWHSSCLSHSRLLLSLRPLGVQSASRYNYCSVEQKQYEEFVVEFANTVSNPWAMMIHSYYTSFADRTMMHSFLFDHITFKAITHFV